MASSRDVVPLETLNTAGETERRSSDDVGNNDPPPPYESRQTPSYAAAEGTGKGKKSAFKRTCTQPRLAGAGCLLLIIVILATVIPLKNKGESVNLPSGPSPTSTSTPVAQSPPTALPESKLAAMPGVAAGTETLIYQNTDGELTLYNTGQPMNWTRLLRSQDLLSGVPMAAIFFPRGLAFPGTKPLTVDYSYIFYLNPSGNPTFLTANSSDYAFTPQNSSDALARPTGNNTGISSLAATPSMVDANGAGNGIEFFTCGTSSPPIQEYAVLVGDPTPHSGNSSNVFSDVTCESITFINHGGVTYFLALTHTSPSTIQMFYKNATDTNSDWKSGAQFGIGLPPGNKFCASGELLAWQGADMNLRGATIVFNDSDPSKTDYHLINSGGVLTDDIHFSQNGTSLACSWSASDNMAIYHQNHDSKLGAFRISPRTNGDWIYDPLDCTACGF